jgi:DNA-binding NarL/FixJ family response regulator
MKDKLVFFVDDDKMILNLLEYTFKSRQGLRVKTFFSGEECIQNLYLNPDIVVLDHVFQSEKPNLNGIEILKRLKKLKKKIRVIILSKHKDERIISEYLKNGAAKYIPKENFFIDELIESIDSF